MRTIWIAALAAGFFSVAAVAVEDSAGQGSAGQGSAGQGSAGQGSALEFENVWVRAMPPFQKNSAGYLTLTNRGDNAIAIVGASSNVAKSVELHTTLTVDGLVRMEKLPGLAVAPGERLELAPGGKHLMLLGLAFRLVPGDDVQLCLQLASGDEVCTDAEVRMSGDEPDAHDHQNHHPTE